MSGLPAQIFTLAISPATYPTRADANDSSQPWPTTMPVTRPRNAPPDPGSARAGLAAAARISHSVTRLAAAALAENSIRQ